MELKRITASATSWGSECCSIADWFASQVDA